MRTEPKRFRDLEVAIDGVVESYTANLEINNLESSALPNKRAVTDAFEHLKHALFMGFYSTRTLTKDNLRQGVAEQLYAAYCVLVEQIERALTYDHWMGRSDRKLPAGSGEKVVLALFKDIPELRRLLNADVTATLPRRPSRRSCSRIRRSRPSSLTASRTGSRARVCR